MFGESGMLGILWDVWDSWEAWDASLCLLGGLLVYGLWGVSFPPRFYSCGYSYDPKFIDQKFDPKIEDRKFQKENPASTFRSQRSLAYEFECLFE